MKAGHADQMRIKAMFPLSDQNKLIVHLDGFDWDFETFGPVTLVIGRERIRFNYTASGNQEGVPFVVLQPGEGSVPTLVQKTRALFDSTAADCWLFRPSEVGDVS